MECLCLKENGKYCFSAAADDEVLRRDRVSSVVMETNNFVFLQYAKCNRYEPFTRNKINYKAKLFLE